jgi:hypothetical protein
VSLTDFTLSLSHDLVYNDASGERKACHDQDTEDRIWVDYDKIPRTMKNATIRSMRTSAQENKRRMYRTAGASPI